MANFLIVGSTLVEPSEYLEKKQLGQIDKFVNAVQAEKPGQIEFSNGSITTADFATSRNLELNGFERSGDVTPFTEIGLGKPLCIEILTVYTGDYPNGIFGGKKDLMLTSAIKSSVTFDAATKAINKIDKKPSEKTYVEFTASQPGTRVVYYTPAVDALNTSVSFELVADTFEQEVFDQVSKLLQSAAGVPVFLAASTYLLAGSHILKAVGNLGNTLFAKKAYLRGNYELKFNNAGDFDSIARSLLIFNDADSASFKEYEAKLINDNGQTKFRLVKKGTEEVYNGAAPYLIISLNGQVRADLGAFTPKLASSALLHKFYGEDDVQGTVGATLEQAMQLYNDLTYKNKADKLSALLKQIPQGSDDYKKNEALLQAYIKNIQTEDFKPK